jgi:hypothetical protein
MRRRCADDQSGILPGSGRVASMADDDRGAVIVVFAVLMSALLVVVAIVVDLGMDRATSRILKSNTDLSAVTGGFFLSGQGTASPVSNPQYACAAVLSSMKSNLKDFPPGATMSPGCTNFPFNAASCVDDVTAKQTLVSQNSAPYVLKIEYPILAADIRDSRLVNGTDLADGTSSCSRMRITLSRTNPSVFGGLLGVRSVTVTQSTTFRSGIDASGVGVPALLLLERQNCATLQASGQGGVRVKASGAKGGWIHSDTAAGGVGSTNGMSTSNCAVTTTCTGSNTANNYSVYGTGLPPSAGGGPSIFAEDNSNGGLGVVSAYAQMPRVNGSIGCNYPGGINNPTTGNAIVSRNPVDLRYNFAFSSFGNTIRQMHATGYGLTTTTVPNGFTAIGVGAGNNTDAACSTWDNVEYKATSLYVSCPNGFTSKNVVFRGQHLIFTGPLQAQGGYLAFPNAKDIYVRGCTPSVSCQGIGLNVASGGFLSVNGGEMGTDVSGTPFDYRVKLTNLPDAITDHTAQPTLANWANVNCLTQRNGPGGGGTTANNTILATFGGTFSMQNATGNLCQTFVYLGDNTPTWSLQSLTTGGNCLPALPCPSNSPPTGPIFDLNSGSAPALQWTAPLLNPNGPNAASPFDDLALWTEGGGSSTCSIAGQGAVNSSGIFFMPNCNFTYGGQANSNNPLNAQFIARTLTMAGQGVLSLLPNPEQSIVVPQPGGIQIIR